MIEVPILSTAGQQVGSLQVDEQKLGGEVQHGLLKQAYVRIHANKRLGTSKTKTRSEVDGSTRKLYKQKGTGNARRGTIRANILRGGGHGKAKRPHSWRLDMPRKMRRLANRNALLAKLIDGEVKLVDGFGIQGKASTKQFASLLSALKIDRSCLLAVPDTRGIEGRSAKNIEDVSLTQIDRLNVFDLLNHRYVLIERGAFETYLNQVTSELPEVSGQEGGA